MPNGKGALDCSYCVHYDAKSDLDVHGQERLCRFHQTVLPKPKKDYHNRICGNFEPTELYHAHNPFHQFCTLARRFAWFGIDLEPGVLYEFSYNDPPGITQSAVLRIPDYDHGTWTKPTG